jgi:hypothetical protein
MIGSSGRHFFLVLSVEFDINMPGRLRIISRLSPSRFRKSTVDSDLGVSAHA